MQTGYTQERTGGCTPTTMPITDKSPDERSAERRNGSWKRTAVMAEIVAVFVVVVLGIFIAPAFGLALLICALVGGLVGLHCCLRSYDDRR